MCAGAARRGSAQRSATCAALTAFLQPLVTTRPEAKEEKIQEKTGKKGKKKKEKKESKHKSK